MPIQFRCPHCDKLLALGARQGGTQIHCPMCDRLITVPPRTQVQMPTTTVVLPDVSQAWWLDAPPVFPPPAEPLPTTQPPPAPSPSAEAWWLAPHEPAAAPETASVAAPSSEPPPLPEATTPAPLSAPKAPLDFGPPLLAPAPARKTIVLPEKPPGSSTPRPFPRKYVYLLAGLFLAVVLAAAAIIAWFYRFNSASQHPIEAPPGIDTKQDGTPSAPPDAETLKEESKKGASPIPLVVKYRRETTEDELRHEAARFPEISLDRGDDRTEAQRVWHLATTAARDGTAWDFGSRIVKERSDLTGLPLRPGEKCRLSATAADRLHSSALALRAALFQAADGGTEVDANKLRTLLDADDAPHNKWLQPEAVPALQQLLMGESASLREVLVDRLARINGPQASIALARTALFDLHPNVRRRALTALAERKRRDYQQVLLDGFGYPWPAVADHAAEALAALNLHEAVPALITMLDQPNPAAPFKKADTEALYVREVVRTNHLHNCLLCHAPSLKESDKLRGFVPSPGQPVPAPFTREYYGARRRGQFIRADITYFQQDFSVPMPAKEPGKWPAVQRYDFLVRERPAAPATTSAVNEHQQALFFALRQLAGTDAGLTVEDWKRWAKQEAR